MMASGLDFLVGGGEMGERMRAKDWSTSPLGPPSSWPQNLKTCVRIVLTSRQPMFVWWGDLFINLYNDAYKSIVGGKHPDALGQPASVVWREVWDQVRPRVAQTMRGTEGTYDEALLFIMERNGYREETYYTFSYSPVPNDRGGTGGIICANTDDTRRIVGERQIALLRDLATRMADAKRIDDAVTLAATSLESNPRDLPFALLYLVEPDKSRAVLGGTAGIRRGHRAAVEIVALDAEGPWPVGEVTRSHESRIVDDIGSRFGDLPAGAWPEPPTRAVAVPIPPSGRTGNAGVLVVGLNPFRLFDDDYRGFLTLVAGQIAAGVAKAQAHEEEKRRGEALEELDRAKMTFFSNVSHEFRTPLTLLLGPVEDALGSEEKMLVGENLYTVHRNALRLLKLVNALLDFARIEAGRAKAAYRPTDLAVLTTDLASAFRSAIERAGVTYRVDCAPLPEPIFVDHDMWETIVLNLISNAFKFTFEGSISVRQRNVDDAVELEVSDTGTGISAAELPRVFERFHRIEGARSRSHEGSGIGLALVHELVRMHGGRIEVRSQERSGTTFTVRIPRGSAHLPADRVSTERTPEVATTAASTFVDEALRWVVAAPSVIQHGQDTARPSAARALPKARIVVADDNADVREYATRLLREHWDVEAVSDGRAALDAIRRTPPDLVLSDVMMPGLDGFGLLRAIRNDASLRDIPVVLLSARAGAEAVSEGLSAGADDYLVKPFIARELLVRVAARLSAASKARDLREQRANLYRTFMHAPFPIAIFRGRDHVIEAINNVALELWHEGAGIVGKPVRDALPELRDQPLPALLDQVYRSASPRVRREEIVRLAKGPGGVLEDRFFNYVYAPILDTAGNPEGIMVSAFDVTDQVRGREALKATSIRLEATNRAKDEFLATMSHELRTPLNAMLGWATMLKSDPHDEAKLERGLSVIERNAHMQTRLVGDLLDVSCIITGKLRLNMEETQVSSAIHAAADAVRQGAEAKGVRLVVDLDPNVGTVIGDPERLQQIVWNLLSNAVRFTPAKGRITVNADRTESGISIVVEDTGDGIPAEHLPYIFERFRQVDSSTTRAHGGLGLGLAIVRHLVEAHGGTVSAKSDGPERGATFSVVLPVHAVDASCLAEAEARAAVQAKAQVEAKVEDEAEAEAQAATNTPASVRRNLKNVHVLVVDDDPDALELLRLVLEGEGALVTTATSAHEALKAPGPFEVIVSDIGMPEMDGYMFMRDVRARTDSGARTPAIALTAYACTEDVERAVRAGYQEHLAKPVDARVLVETLKRWARVPTSAQVGAITS